MPLVHLLGDGWRGGLLIWAAHPLIALLVWLPQLAREGAHAPTGAPPARMRELTREPLTWHLTIFFAMQAWGFTRRSRGSRASSRATGSHTYAGLLLGVSGVMGAPAALVVPSLAVRMRHQGGAGGRAGRGHGDRLCGLLLAPAGAPA